VVYSSECRKNPKPLRYLSTAFELSGWGERTVREAIEQLAETVLDKMPRSANARSFEGSQGQQCEEEGV